MLLIDRQMYSFSGSSHNSSLTHCYNLLPGGRGGSFRYLTVENIMPTNGCVTKRAHNDFGESMMHFKGLTATPKINILLKNVLSKNNRCPLSPNPPSPQQ